MQCDTDTAADVHTTTDIETDNDWH